MQGRTVLLVLALVALSQSIHSHSHEQPQSFDVDFVKLRTVEQMVGQWAVEVGVVRSRLLAARGQPGANFIKLVVNLPDGVEFQWANSSQPQTTNPNQRILTYNISVNNVYPTPNYFQITQKWIEKGKQMQRQRAIKFSATYTRTYEVSHFIGIMIAEQIRFSTLVDSVNDPKYEINKVPRQWKDLFNYFYDNFKQQVYNNWKNSGNGPVTARLINGNTVIVRILVPWRAGP